MDYAALETYETYKAEDGVRDPRLPADLGTVHSIRRSGRVDEPEFYRGEPMHAECGRAVRVRLQVLFDAEDPDSCEDCAAFIRGDKPRPRRFGSSECNATARDDDDHLVGCILFPKHKGSHKTGSGQVWEDGSAYVSPAPDGYT